jgi:hypothetical protein
LLNRYSRMYSYGVAIIKESPSHNLNPAVGFGS